MNKTTLTTVRADPKLKPQTAKAIQDALVGVDLYTVESVDALWREVGKVLISDFHGRGCSVHPRRRALAKSHATGTD